MLFVKLDEAQQNYQSWNTAYVCPYFAKPFVHAVLFFGAMVAELKRTWSLSQSIEPLSMQNVSTNSFVEFILSFANKIR